MMALKIKLLKSILLIGFLVLATKDIHEPHAPFPYGGSSIRADQPSITEKRDIQIEALNKKIEEEGQTISTLNQELNKLNQRPSTDAQLEELEQELARQQALASAITEQW